MWHCRMIAKSSSTECLKSSDAFVKLTMTE
jgi:hypothetical protein